MIAKFLSEDYSDETLLKCKGQPKSCRFKDHSSGGVFGAIMCHHSDFKGYMCIEDWCLAFIKKELWSQYKR